MHRMFVAFAGLVVLSACTGPQTSEPIDEPTPTLFPPTDTPPPGNLLANPGFELGESWWFEDNGVATHAWVTTGDAVFNSAATISAPEGSYVQKIWGRYADAVPNDSESGLNLAELTPGDTLAFSVQAMTHADDRVSGGNVVRVFLRFQDAAGAPLGEVTGKVVIDATTEADTWHTLGLEAEVPKGAVRGQLGVRYGLADWSAGGSVYLDQAVLLSSGTGRVVDERLLVWNDEFAGNSVDSTRWNKEILAPYTYNAELQQYTADEANARVADGRLTITALPESGGNDRYSSARLNTDGKAGWTYGRIEGALQVPSAIGTWPALWMLPTDWVHGGWPASGEIDIMEHVGCDANIVVGTVHTGAYNHTIGTQQGGDLDLPTATTATHVYAIDWTPERINFMVDGAVYYTFANDGLGNPDTWPFDEVFHLVVNLAVGGTWGGYCGVDRAAFPQQYTIDWIRVYQNPETEGVGG